MYLFLYRNRPITPHLRPSLRLDSLLGSLLNTYDSYQSRSSSPHQTCFSYLPALPSTFKISTNVSQTFYLNQTPIFSPARGVFSIIFQTNTSELFRLRPRLVFQNFLNNIYSSLETVFIFLHIRKQIFIHLLYIKTVHKNSNPNTNNDDKENTYITFFVIKFINFRLHHSTLNKFTKKFSP